MPSRPANFPDYLREADADRRKLILVLAQFHLSIDEFDRKPVQSYEQQIAGCSPDLLKILYLTLLKPGVTMRARLKLCPPWPEGGRYAGTEPHNDMLGRIRRRLLAAARSAHGLPAEPGKQTAAMDEPYDPIAEKRKARAMIDKIYGLPPRPEK